MIALLSPAKTLDYSETTIGTYSTPRLLADSSKLVKVLKKKSANDLKTLMKVSDNIANLNVERFNQFSAPFSLDNAKQSILAFKGDVYQGLEAFDFDEAEHAFAQDHSNMILCKSMFCFIKIKGFQSLIHISFKR